MPTTLADPAPIPLALGGGALTAGAGFDGLAATLPLVIDTGTPLTAYDDGSGLTRARMGQFRLLSAEKPPVPRLQIDDIELFVTPLRMLGAAPAAVQIGAVLGGDNLQRFAATFDYRDTPTMSLTHIITTCSCVLADDCQAVFPFMLQGGQEALAIGGDLFSYPPTRVVLDACLEPLADPVAADIPCTAPPTAAGQAPDPLAQPDPRYQPHGVEAKLLVATGFPGLALGVAAFDRLRGAGSARALIDGPNAIQLHLPDPGDDGPLSVGLRAGVATLGASELSALALVSREGYYGPCGELARSRRQRRVPPNFQIANGADPRLLETNCLRTPSSGDLLVNQCRSETNDSIVCDDTQSPVAAVLEFTQPLTAFVIDDTSALLQTINADVRPSNATVEGVIGTEVLKRLVSTIDYPNGRFIARCASDADCTTYPRYVVASECGSDCGRPSCLYYSPPTTDVEGHVQSYQGDCPTLPGVGGRCSAAPARQ